MKEQQRFLLRQSIKSDWLFRWLRRSAQLSDTAFTLPFIGRKRPVKIGLDPILGFIFPALGDVLFLGSLLPALWISLFRIRSVALTIAIVFNGLLDAVVGCIPFLIGDLLDVAVKSNVKNYRLIVGYLDDDPKVRNAVRRKAIFLFVGCLLLLALLVALVWFGLYLLWQLFQWLGA